MIWWAGHCPVIAALTPAVLPLLKAPPSARKESIIAREATLRHLFFVRLQAYAEFFWEHRLYDLVRNAEEYIHVRLEYRSQAVIRCYRSVDAPLDNGLGNAPMRIHFVRLHLAELHQLTRRT